MPIEFNCSGCGKLLRVPDEFAGRQARCPHCGGVSQAPEAAAPMSEPTAWAPPSNPPNEHGSQASGATGDPSPYQSPLADETAAPVVSRAVAAKVEAPAIAMIVVGGLDILICLVGVLGVVFQFAILNNALPGGGPPQMPFAPKLGVGINLVSIVLSVGISVFMLYAGLQMRKLQNHGLSVAAAILAIVPCFGGCCLWDIPIGIWALVILLQNDVVEAFRRNVH